MSITYRKIVESGGADTIFIWHVCGYPWAVATDNRIVTLASATDTDADAQFIRKKIFGDVTVGEYTPAYTARIFPTLSSKLGAQTTKVKGPGMIDVTSWQLEIFDEQIGGEVDYIETGDVLWGLDGLHRTPNLNRAVHGWGFLSDNLGLDDGAISIHDESQELHGRIISTNTYKPLWIGHECIAVTGVTGGTNPDYTATIGGRGLYRSKPQYHFTYPLEGLSQKIADVPNSIAGHFCELWAVPITSSGGFFYDDSGNPIIAKERFGTVSTDIGTNGGVTSVKVLGPLEALKTDINYSIADGVNAHLSKYHFCRGPSGTKWENIYKYGQKPHLTIMEYHAIREGEDYKGWWTSVPIWLCEKNSSVIFDTVEDLVDALNIELEACYVGSANRDSQKSGDGTEGNYRVSLSHTYNVTKKIIAPRQTTSGKWETVQLETIPMWFIDQTSGGADKSILPVVDGGLHEEGVRFIFGKWSQVSGILQVILGLGVPHFPERNKTMVVLNRKDNSAIDCYQDEKDELWHDQSWRDDNFWIPGYTDREREFLEGNAYTENDDGSLSVTYHRYSVPAGLCRREEVGQLEAPEDFYVATYFKQWDFINHGVGDAYDNWASGRAPVRIGEVRFIYSSASGNYSFWLDERVSPLQFPTGTEVKIGSYTGTVSNFSTSNGDNYMLLSDHLEPQAIEDCAVGSFLTCVPAYCIDDGADPSVPENVNSEWIESEDDPYTVRLNRSSFVGASGVDDIVKAFIGYNDTSIFIPFNERKLWVPFFRTDGDFVSHVDWDSLGSLTDMFNAASCVVIPDSSFKLYSAIDAELKLYCLTMYQDWDDANNQVLYRFRPFGEVVTSDTLMRGRVINESNLTVGSVPEDHGDMPLYNKFTVNYSQYPSGEEMKITVSNRDVFSLVQRDVLNMEIEPMFTRFIFDNKMMAVLHMMDARMFPMLSRTSAVKPLQKRGVTWASRFITTPGLEVLVTDPAAHYPQTHALGIESASVFITEQTVDLSTAKVRVAYLVAGDAEVHGYAPSCRCNVGNVTLNADGFTFTPEDYYGSTVYAAKDVFYFDCMDLSDPNNPTFRTDECGDYAVLIYAQDEEISANNPIPGTCKVINDSGTWKIRVYCDESLLPSTGKLIIQYAAFDDCESCQKAWLFFSDDLGSVGAEARQGDTWR